MPSSPIDRFPLSDNSSHSFDCTANISSHYDEESENEMKSFAKYRFSPGHALLRKQFQRPIILQASKTCGRRRFTFSGHQEHKIVKKRRRFTTIVPPKRFLLGGNITDPLNLGSLQDEKINQQLNAFSPASSPMPLPTRRNQVQLIIPPNINDPLNLNDGQDIEFNLLSTKPRKRRRHRRGRKEDEDSNQISEEISPYVITKEGIILFSVYDDCLEKEQEPSNEETIPLLESPVKIAEKICIPNKEKSAAHNERRKAKKRIEAMKYRKNVAKYCYGNRVADHSVWNFGDDYAEDPRLRFLHENLFRGKDVLDIGCNTGDITLYIAMHFQPTKVVGIDIDKKLIDRGQKQVRLHLNLQIESEMDFPESMAVVYGPLAKVMPSSSKLPKEFPNNISFFEANYVPASEDYLETQKPEYDTILCLRVTKWIHLNFGDEGLKMAFKRMFAQLRYGGHLILEPQPWFTYSASKRITPAIYDTYRNLQMRPESFCDYLLSDEVGFHSCEVIGRTFHYTKAYRQDIYLFRKGYKSSHDLLYNTLSPIPFHYDMWSHSINDEFSNFAEEEIVPTDL